VKSIGAAKLLTIATLIAGLALTVALVVGFGARDIGAAFVRLGIVGFIIFCAAHAPVVALLGLAWRFCMPAASRIRLTGVIAARMLRDAGAEVLPLSELGGFVIGARAATLAGASGVEAAASTLVDLTTEAAAQLGFIALGLIALWRIKPDAALIRPAALALAVLIVFTALAALNARRGAALMALARAAIGRWFAGFGDVDGAFATMGAIARQRGAIAGAVALHLLGWLSVAA
jgi:hypothetical protein